MYLDKDREIVYTSVHNIPDRLKEIDPGYFLVRNHKRKNFEVHHSEQIGGTYCLTVPYDELDYRTLQLVRSTRIEYASKIYEEMERNNEKLEQEGIKKVKDASDYVTREIHRYVSTHESKDTIDSDSSLLKGVI